MLSKELPTNPSYDEACHLIDFAEDEYWLPIIQQICAHHNIDLKQCIRIKEGANVLFEINGKWIIKIVPPNWAYQGIAEIESQKLLTGKLSVSVPDLIASGTINRWIYAVMTVMNGQTLANIWPDINKGEKIRLVAQLGNIIDDLHKMVIPLNSRLAVSWDKYIQQLISDCVPRHKRKAVPHYLVEQITDYIDQVDYICDDGESIFIHMDLHPWNLMVEETNGEYRISGVLDFGDAIIGRSRLLELATPILFMCQGDFDLIKVLLKSYQQGQIQPSPKLQQELMVVSLLRPACDFNFVLQQVPATGPRENWQQISQQLFPCK